MKKASIIFGLSFLFAACRPNVTVTIPASSGNTDFSVYMSFGSSYAGGFSDNSLEVSGQVNSYPNLLFQQFQLVPGDAGGSKSYFVQPLLNSNNGYPYAKLVLGSFFNPCTMDSIMIPVNYPSFVMDPTDAIRYTWQNSNYNNGQINNMAVPGMRVADLPVAGYVLANPYAARFFLKNAPTNTPLDEIGYRVRNTHPSFVTVDIGLQDILGFALSGGVGDGTGYASPITGTTNVYQDSAITPYAVFQTQYDALVLQAINTPSPKGGGALFSIPDITAMPYFNVFPSNGLVITRQTLADSLNKYWKSYTPKVTINKDFQVGNNQYIVMDHNNNIRQSVPGELILMDAPFFDTSCATMSSFGAHVPIPNKYVLTTEELQEIRSATAIFNNYIYNESLKYHLAYVDVNKYLNNVGYSSVGTTGVVFNGITYNSNFISGGFYSLDGVHLTQRGYAQITNLTIQQVDSFYHATLPLINVNNYNGVLYY